MHKVGMRGLLQTALFGLLVGSALGQVNLVGTFGGTAGDKVGLRNVGVNRGGVDYLYQYDEMISGDLASINVPGSNRTVLLYADPLDSSRDQAMSDQWINTGFLDAGEGPGDFSAGSEGFRLDFDEPVRNDAGPDLLVMSIAFDFASGGQSNPTDYFVSFDGTNANLVQSSGTPQFRTGGVDSIPYYAFAGGATQPSDLLGSAQQTGSLGNSTATAIPTLQSLDLSSFGIASGQSVSSIWIQDSSLNANGFFPTMVLGLPAIPEPATGLMLLVGLSLLRRPGRS